VAIELKKLLDLLAELIKNRYYGSLEIKFENGVIVIIKKSESIK